MHYYLNQKLLKFCSFISSHTGIYLVVVNVVVVNVFDFSIQVLSHFGVTPMTPPPPEVVYPRVVQSLYKQWRQDTQSGKVLPPCILRVLRMEIIFASRFLQELSHPPVLKELFKDEGSLKRCLENQLDIERKVQCFQLSLFCVFCSSA